MWGQRTCQPSNSLPRWDVFQHLQFLYQGLQWPLNITDVFQKRWWPHRHCEAELVSGGFNETDQKASVGFPLLLRACGTSPRPTCYKSPRWLNGRRLPWAVTSYLTIGWATSGRCLFSLCLFPPPPQQARITSGGGSTEFGDRVSQTNCQQTEPHHHGPPLLAPLTAAGFQRHSQNAFPRAADGPAVTPPAARPAHAAGPPPRAAAGSPHLPARPRGAERGIEPNVRISQAPSLPPAPRGHRPRQWQGAAGCLLAACRQRCPEAAAAAASPRVPARRPSARPAGVSCPPPPPPPRGPRSPRRGRSRARAGGGRGGGGGHLIARAPPPRPRSLPAQVPRGAVESVTWPRPPPVIEAGAGE